MSWQGASSSRGGLNSRAHLLNQDQVQIRIDPASSFDSEVESLQRSVRGLKQLTYAIDEERKAQGEVIDEVDGVLAQTGALLSRVMRKMNVAHKRAGRWDLLWLVLFAIVLFTMVYVVAKMVKMGRAVLR